MTPIMGICLPTTLFGIQHGAIGVLYWENSGIDDKRVLKYYIQRLRLETKFRD